MKRETPAAAESAIAARERRAGRGNLEAAVVDWSRDLGATQVLTAASELDRYARSTISRPVRALAVLRPGDREQVIAAFVEDLRPLRLDGTIRSVVHMGNDLRVISSGMSYPRHFSPAGGPLSPALRAQLRAAGGVGPWTAAGGR